MDNDHPELTDELVDAIGDYTDMMTTGKEPGLDEYCARFPQLAPRLRELLEVALWIREEADWFHATFPGMKLSEFLALSRKEQDELIRRRRRPMAT